MQVKFDVTILDVYLPTGATGYRSQSERFLANSASIIRRRSRKREEEGKADGESGGKRYREREKGKAGEGKGTTEREKVEYPFSIEGLLCVQCTSTGTCTYSTCLKSLYYRHIHCGPCCVIYAGLGTAFYSILNASFFCVLLKYATFFYVLFSSILATYETQKNDAFFSVLF